jgi:hypothetical protein
VESLKPRARVDKSRRGGSAGGGGGGKPPGAKRADQLITGGPGCPGAEVNYRMHQQRDTTEGPSNGPFIGRMHCCFVRPADPLARHGVDRLDLARVTRIMTQSRYFWNSNALRLRLAFSCSVFQLSGAASCCLLLAACWLLLRSGCVCVCGGVGGGGYAKVYARVYEGGSNDYIPCATSRSSPKRKYGCDT